MVDRVDVAIVGAGPYGLSVAAHLPGRARVFGAPLDTWRTRMPPDMLLRSAWEETSLSAPAGGTIDDWAAATGEARQEPIPLQSFLRYADWFRRKLVSDHDESDVARVDRVGESFRVVPASGREVEVRSVVVAVGVTPFARAPSPLAPGPRVTFAIDEGDVSRLSGARVLVVGAGQAGLESAGLAARAGASVELLARSGVRWFADREPHHERSALGRRLHRLAYPAIGYGPPPLNRLVLHPDLFAALPRRARTALTERMLRPGGSPWVRALVGDAVQITEGAVVTGVDEQADGIGVELSDGSSRDVDHILLAAGYRFELERLAFLAPALRESVRVEHGWPVLDRSFRSTVPGLFFVGYPAEGRFGPLSRFVLGCPFTARRVADALV